MIAEPGPSMGVGLVTGVFSVDSPTHIQLWGRQDHQRDDGRWVVARQQSGYWGMPALGKPQPVQDHTGWWQLAPSPV